MKRGRTGGSGGRPAVPSFGLLIVRSRGKPLRCRGFQTHRRRSRTFKFAVLVLRVCHHQLFIACVCVLYFRKQTSSSHLTKTRQHTDQSHVFSLQHSAA